MLGVQARLGRRRDEVDVVDAEAQIDLGVDAVDVLATRAAAAAVRDAQLLDGNVAGEFAVLRCGLKVCEIVSGFVMRSQTVSAIHTGAGGV